jgi:polyisoprenoid-binding protein YceI
MKALKITAAILFITTVVFSQTYTPADAGSKVHFVIKNFGIKTGGDFSGLKGVILFDPKAITTSRFNVSVNSKTIDTDNGTRDNHLRKSEYFDVEKYPLISFVSSKVTQGASSDLFHVTGNLTIKGITKELQFDFSATPLSTGYLFKGEFDINRRDFTVGGNSISMSDHLHVSLSVTANK